MPTVNTTARDLVPSTDAPTPDSPIMGGSDDTLKLGKESLKIKLNDPTTIKF